MHCRFYLRKGMVYIPTQALVDRGFYLDVEPVAAVALSDTDALRKAFSDAITRGNPSVPRPKQSEFRRSVVLGHAGVKTWGTFARGTTTWSISERDGIFQIRGYRKEWRWWVQDENKLETFPPGKPAAEVIERLIAILQEAAQKASSNA